MSLKVRLLLGAAAPLVFVLPAVAQTTTISTATTTPVATSGSDVDITSAGSISVTTAGTTVVTVNTNNKVTNAGLITTNNADNTVGVRLLPNLTTSYSTSGSGGISLIEDYTRTDSTADTDTDLDGPLAQGTNRIGLLLDAGGTMTGDISIRAGGQVTVEGNNSSAISLRSALNGTYRQAGSISVTGSNGVTLDIREDVSGDVILGGGVTAQGEGSAAVKLLGDVTGEFQVNGGILATGFTSLDSNITNYADPDELKTGDTPIADRLDPDDLLIGGSAVEIRGDLVRGFLINGAATGGVDPTPDVKDVIQNFNEDRTTGSVTSLGSAPAVLIQALDGAAGDTLQLGRVRESVHDIADRDADGNFDEVLATFNYDYGFINRGTIIGNGVNVGIAATGLKIAGSADGTHQTIVDGGIFNGGSIIGSAREANATGLLIGSGATTPTLVIAGNANVQAQTFTETNHDSVAVKIEAGANVPSVVNGGLILASTRGYDGDAIAFQDLSGTVTSFTNNSRLTSGYIDNNATDDITSGLGRAIAADLSHSLLGVTFTQTDTADNTRTFGDVLLGAGGDSMRLLSGEMVGDINFGTGSDTLTINSAKLFGNATFAGSGANVLITGGEMDGDLLLGAATGSLAFANQAIYNGGISRTGGGAMTLSVNNATVNNSGAGTLQLSSMSLANNAKMGFVINNARVTSNTPIFNVTGAADIAANTVFTPIFQQFTNQAFTLRVINAGTLNLGGSLDSMLNANSPYLYNVSLQRPAGSQAIDLVLRVKNETELGLNTRQAGAYNAVLDLLVQDDDVATAVTSIPGAADFLRGWNDLLPASDSSIVRVLSTNATAAFGATAHRLDLVSDKPNAPGGAWTEEFGVYHSVDANSDTVGISGGGFGVAAGVDVLSTGTALIGAFVALESAELEEETRTSAPLNVSQTSIGAYGGWLNGNLAVNGAASMGFVDFTSDRRLDVGGLTDRVKGSWSGMTYTAAGRASYTMPLGWLDVKPYIAADYVSFDQDGYTETGATNTGLQLTAGNANSSLATASYGFELVGNLGSDDAYSIKPTLSVGYRNVLNWKNSSATYRFEGNSPLTSFQLRPGDEPEDGIVAGLGLNIDSQFLNMKIGYDAEVTDNAITHYGSITLRMAFW